MARRDSEQPAPRGEWRVNQHGQACFDGECFGILGDPSTGDFVIEFDDQCDVDAAAQAEKAFLKNVLEQRGVTYRKRRSHD
jgi:hypothetical protein